MRHHLHLRLLYPSRDDVVVVVVVVVAAVVDPSSSPPCRLACVEAVGGATRLPASLAVPR